jgi:hypothetical protein
MESAMIIRIKMQAVVILRIAASFLYHSYAWAYIVKTATGAIWFPRFAYLPAVLYEVDVQPELYIVSHQLVHDIVCLGRVRPRWDGAEPFTHAEDMRIDRETGVSELKQEEYRDCLSPHPGHAQKVALCLFAAHIPQAFQRI